MKRFENLKYDPHILLRNLDNPYLLDTENIDLNGKYVLPKESTHQT